MADGGQEARIHRSRCKDQLSHHERCRLPNMAPREKSFTTDINAVMPLSTRFISNSALNGLHIYFKHVMLRQSGG